MDEPQIQTNSSIDRLHSARASVKGKAYRLMALYGYFVFLVVVLEIIPMSLFESSDDHHGRNAKKILDRLVTWHTYIGYGLSKTLEIFFYILILWETKMGVPRPRCLEVAKRWKNDIWKIMFIQLFASFNGVILFGFWIISLFSRVALIKSINAYILQLEEDTDPRPIQHDKNFDRM